MSRQLNNIYNLLERIDNTFQNIRLLNEELILEAASLSDVYQKYYSDIPEEEFKQIVHADPTSGEDKMGKYSKWLLALRKNGNLEIEDLYKATQYLTTFHRYKDKLDKKDIGQYKSLPDLYNAIEPYSDNTQAASHKEEIRQIKKDAEKVYEDDRWLVIVPKTKEAAIEYGKGTQWCTAATGSYNYFDYYNSQGPLFININKKTGRKYQFHFESGQFMDETDSPVSRTKVMSKKLKEFYLQKVGLEAIYDSFKEIEGNDTEEKLFIVRKGTKFNIINEHNDIKLNIWYNGIYGFDKDSKNVAEVKLKNRVNFINRNFELIFDEWFDWATRFNCENCLVYNKEKGYNFVNQNGYLLSDFYFDAAQAFHDKYARVSKNGKWNIINKDGDFISDEWFDYMGDLGYYTRVAPVKRKEGNWYESNFINAQGKIISDEWFKDTGAFECVRDEEGSELCIVTRKDGSQNVITPEGEFYFENSYQNIYIEHGDTMILQQNDKKILYGIKEKSFLIDFWCDDISIDGMCAILELNGKKTVYYMDGRRFCLPPDMWVDEVRFLSNSQTMDQYLIKYEHAFVKVYNDGKMNIILFDGTPLLNVWVDDVVGYNYYTRTVKVMDNLKYNSIDLKTGNLIHDTWTDNGVNFYY